MEWICRMQSLQTGITVLFFLCCFYQLLYIIVPLWKKPKAHKPEKPHRYGVLIAARNEEQVIGCLLDSIREQDYPDDLVDVFVVADNCTDATARVARERGAVVYERYNETMVGKGYALDYLLRRMEEDGMIYDGYLVFDADNLLQKDYITQINRAFSDGYEIVTSYRNSKNYGDSWISSGCGLWFLRETAGLNEPRHLLGTSCAVSGTGFLFSRKVLEENRGWPFHLLTEDVEFSVAEILKGRRIGFCGAAEYFDEQPVDLGQSVRQRLRWSKGYLQVMARYGGALLRGCFRKGGFACFDMLMSILPAIVLGCTGILTAGASLLAALITGEGFLLVIRSLVWGAVWGVLLLFLLGAVTLVSQWDRVPATPWQKLRSLLTFPLYTATCLPVSVAAVFCRVEWRPIRHTVAISRAALPVRGKKWAGKAA